MTAGRPRAPGLVYTVFNPGSVVVLDEDGAPILEVQNASSVLLSPGADRGIVTTRIEQFDIPSDDDTLRSVMAKALDRGFRLESGSLEVLAKASRCEPGPKESHCRSMATAIRGPLELSAYMKCSSKTRRYCVAEVALEDTRGLARDTKSLPR